MRKSKRPKIVGRYVSLWSRKPYEKVFKTSRGAFYVDKKVSIRKTKRYIPKKSRKNIKPR